MTRGSVCGNGTKEGWETEAPAPSDESTVRVKGDKSSLPACGARLKLKPDAAPGDEDPASAWCAPTKALRFEAAVGVVGAETPVEAMDDRLSLLPGARFNIGRPVPSTATMVVDVRGADTLSRLKFASAADVEPSRFKPTSSWWVVVVVPRPGLGEVEEEEGMSSSQVTVTDRLAVGRPAAPSADGT